VIVEEQADVGRESSVVDDGQEEGLPGVVECQERIAAER